MIWIEGDGPGATKAKGFPAVYYDAVGDLKYLEDPAVAAKYGPSISHFQIRALHNPDAWGPLDKVRIAEKLRDPVFASHAAFVISKNGTDFTPWSAFKNGTYLPHVGKDFTLVTGHRYAGLWDTRFASSVKLGQWKVASDLFVNNNVWNATESGTQTLYAASPSKWAVVANHSRTDVRPGSIKSYPDTQQNYTNRPIDSFTEMTASWSTEFPAVGEWFGAFDNWVGGIGSKCTAEVMIWTHHRYNGKLPPSNATESTTVEIAGHRFVAWRRPLNDKGLGQQYIALSMLDHKPVGSLDVLAVFKWLVSKGWLKGSDLVAAIEYGVEIANTAGEERTFTVNDYTLTAK